MGKRSGKEARTTAARFHRPSSVPSLGGGPATRARLEGASSGSGRAVRDRGGELVKGGRGDHALLDHLEGEDDATARRFFPMGDVARAAVTTAAAARPGPDRRERACRCVRARRARAGVTGSACAAAQRPPRLSRGARACGAAGRHLLARHLRHAASLGGFCAQGVSSWKRRCLTRCGRRRIFLLAIRTFFYDCPPYD